MPRLIINYPDSVTPGRALDLVQRVVFSGRISNQGRQFCYATTFHSGESVCSDLTRTGTDVFHISVNE